ncbi:Tn3 family transposase [Saccharopolyspora hattusasensis]|uniref:Tn3 family transposase n=1 Tax=Saccharopolyspora hattusasensis TaxID=1128679 RepID=UPI003D9708AB
MGLFRKSVPGLEEHRVGSCDLHISIAGLLVSESCNIGWTPVIKHSVPALTRDRLAHVDATYLRMDTLKAANAALIEHQARIGLAQVWSGGHVASVDGMRFVVPVQTINARHNPHYWGQRRGATWLNMINDQASGLAGKVVAGTPRDSLHVLDVLYDRDGGQKPQMIVTDTASAPGTAPTRARHRRAQRGIPASAGDSSIRVAQRAAEASLRGGGGLVFEPRAGIALGDGRGRAGQRRHRGPREHGRSLGMFGRAAIDNVLPDHLLGSAAVAPVLSANQLFADEKPRAYRAVFTEEGRP